MTDEAKPAEASSASTLSAWVQHKTASLAGSLARSIGSVAAWAGDLARGRPSEPQQQRPGGLFRKYALLLVALLGGALIVNAAIEMYYSYIENRAALVAIQREKAQAAATVIEQFITEIEGQVGWTTHASFLPGASGLDQRRFDFLRLLRQAPAITEVSYLDAQGREQLKVSRLALDVVGSGTDYSQDPRFREAKANKRYVSPVYFRKESEPYLTMAVTGTGRTSGVTVAEVNLKFIWDVVSRIRIGKAGAAYVVDARGLLIAHPDIGLVLRKTDLSSLPYVEAARRKREAGPAAPDGPAVAIDRTGQEILTASAPIESLGWLVFVDLPLGEAYQPLYASLLRTVIVVGAGLVLAVLAGLWLAQRMVVPIRALAAGAARIGGGELDHRIAIRTGDELQALADVFNEMGARLKSYYANLEHTVEQRTRELQESLEQQTATGEVLSAISRSPSDIAPVLSIIVETARRLCAADYALIFRLHDGLYHLAAASSSDPEFVAYLQQNPIAPGSGTLTGRTALEKRTVYIRDALNDPTYQWREAAQRGNYRTTLGVPLLRNDEVIGVIDLVSTNVNAFSDKQVELVETFADQAIIAIENVRLFEEVQSRTNELQQSLEYQTATSNVLNVISRSPNNLKPVLETIVATAADLCEANDAIILLKEGEWLKVATHRGPIPVDFDKFPVGRGWVTGRAVVECRPVHVHDLLSADDEFPDGSAMSQRLGHRTILAVPLPRDGGAIGGITLRRRETRPFSEKQIALLQTFADQAVIAIENVRLFEEVQARTRELEEALEYQTATSDVLNVISRSPAQIDPVLEAIVETAARLCHAQYAFITKCTDGFCHLVASNVGEEMHAFISRTPVKMDRGSITGRAAAERRTIHVADVLADPEFDRLEWQRVGGQRTILSVPLLREGLLIGVITLFRTAVAPFSPKQVELVTTFADQAVIAIENVRLFEEVQERTRELQESLEYQTATSEVLNVISRSPSELKPVLDTIVTTANRLCEAHDVVLLLKDGDFLKLGAHSGPIPVGFTKHPVNRGWTAGRAVLDRKSIHVQDLGSTKDFPDSQAMSMRTGFRTILTTPLLRDDEGIGTLTLRRTEARPFSAKQMALLQTFADQAVIAIENVRLFEEVQARTRELQESLDYQTATSDVLKAISRSAFDLQGVLDTLVETARRLCGADAAMVFRREENSFRLAASRGYSKELREFLEHTPLDFNRGTAVGRAGVERHTVHIPDVLEDPDYTFFEGQKRGKWRTSLAVPLMREGSPIGAFSLNRSTPRPFTAKQIELVETFADQAVIAIENVRLFEEVQARTRELQESLHLQTATADVLKVISRSTFDLAKVLQVLVETAIRLCEADGGTITRQIGDRFIRAGFAGFSDEFIKIAENVPVVPGRDTISGRALLEAKPVHLLDATSDPEYKWTEALQTGHFRTGLGVPLMREGVPIGVMSLVRRTVRPFTDKQIEILQTFADQAVIAIENVRLFEEVQAKTRELARSIEELKALGEVGKTISSTLDLEAVLNAILMHACRLADSGGGAVYVFDEARGTFELAAGYNMKQELIEAVRSAPMRLGDALIGECAQRREAVQIEDLAEGPRHPVFQMHLETGIRALLAVPLLHQDKVIGALIVRRKRAGAFAADIVELLQSFASQSAIAIQNARLFKEIEDKSRQLELASQHKSQFLANMSHELRTPLNAILGYTELVQDGVYGEPLEKIRAVLERVQANGKHLLGLINDVLDLSKIEAGQLVLRLDAYSLHDVVHTVVTATESLAREKKLAVTVDMPKSLPAGRGDERRIAQVLLNLVGNAIKFTDAGGVTISAKAENGRFEVSVADTGPGIPLDEQSRIFEEFHQVDSSNTKKKGGTGLGLAIAKRIVELHGGGIAVDSEPGQGATFTVELPVRAEQQEDAIARSARRA